MTAAILIVGDDPALLGTSADLLKAWEVSTANFQRGRGGGPVQGFTT